MAEYDVVAAGHVCLDLIPEIAGGSTGETFRPGKLVNVGPALISMGGPVANTGIAMKKLGMRMAFVASVGDDDLGQLAIARLRREGNADGISVSPGRHTSYSVVLSSPDFDRIFLHYPGTNDTFSSSDINEEVLRGAKLFHLGYPPLMRRMYTDDGAELISIFRRVKEMGLTTSLDMSLPDPASESGRVCWRTILRGLLPYVDIFLPSVEEVFYMLEPEAFLSMKEQVGGGELIDHLSAEDYTSLAKTILSMGAKMTSLKSGHRGFYFMTGNSETLMRMGRAKPGDIENWSGREIWCPAFHVARIASATGSGDSSIAGFLSAFLRGHNIERTLKTANCLGYQNLQAPDSLSGIRDWSETTRLIDHEKLEMNDLHIESSAWRWDAVHEMIVGPNDVSSRKTRVVC